MVVEQSQTADEPLPASHERRDVRRAQEAVPEDVKQDLDVALRKLNMAFWLAPEARLCFVGVLGFVFA